MIDTIENKLYLQPILHKKTINVLPQHIYITSEEEIKEGEYGLSRLGEIIKFHSGYDYRYYAKIILTTDQELIADGVQASDDELLEWFVKNPSCEEVEVQKWFDGLDFLEYKIIIPKEEPKQETLEETNMDKFLKLVSDEKSTWIEDLEHYNQNKEELDTKFEIELNDLITEQETLEEAAKRTYQKGLQDDIDLSFYDGVRLGSKWQAERMYTYDELRQIAYNAYCKGQLDEPTEGKFNLWVQQFKKQ